MTDAPAMERRLVNPTGRIDFRSSAFPALPVQWRHARADLRCWGLNVSSPVDETKSTSNLLTSPLRSSILN